jgi:hypothetical protein
MGRWADAFQACRHTRDTADTVDTPLVELSSAGQSVNSVSSVMPLARGCEGLLDQLGEHVSTVSAVSDPKEMLQAAPHGRYEPILTQSASEAANAPTPVQRPVSWADPMDRPTLGSFCSCCRSHRWWCETHKPTGWCCWTCHPPDHLPQDAVMQIRT